mmetsp:Transcript_16989/g.28298  ORF Transcript_16989/g.28298 Transcript_16989/m.28298 type:complete len:286 (-) Transcript_16989:92-949(-)
MTKIAFILFKLLAISCLSNALVDDNDDTTSLPIEIPIDRAFDLQWNPPGHPQLHAWLLDAPWGDRGNDPYGYYDNDDRDGHYTFRINTEDEKMSFVRKKEDGTYVQVFERVEFLLISEDVLMFNGDPHEGGGFPAGGGYGTLIKAPSIPAGGDAGVWDTEPLDESGVITAKEWLLKNFGDTASPAASPTGSPTGMPTSVSSAVNITMPNESGKGGSDGIDKKQGLSAAAFGGIAIGVIIVIAISVFAVVSFWQRPGEPSHLQHSDVKMDSENESVTECDSERSTV